MIVREITDYLESIAPLELQESYDNAGLLVGRHTNQVSGVVCSLDITEEVIDEALSLDANLVVAHHPIIFSGIKSFSDGNYVARIVEKAIRNNVNLYAIHTNLDNVIDRGVNTEICRRLGIHKIQPLLPKNEEKTVGSGAIGYLPEPMATKDFLRTIKQQMGSSVIKYTQLVKEEVQKIAVCGGAGSFLIHEAKRQNADVFVTSDYKYHEFFDADSQIVIADIGHFESEQFTRNLLVELLRKKNSNFAIHLSKVDTNPVRYY